MSNRRSVIKNMMLGGIITATGLPIVANAHSEQTDAPQAGADRKYWWQLLNRIADPVISNLAKGTLIKNMKVELGPGYNDRSVSFTYLEAVGRTLAGIAPWLALPDDGTAEGVTRKKLKEQARLAIAQAVNPASPDYLNFRKGDQPIVDAAFFAHGLLRGFDPLWVPLNEVTKSRVIAEFKSLRDRKPFDNNWLLFGAITEAFLARVGEDYDKPRLVDAVKRMQTWYVGDGWFMDGPRYAFDYYNSFVIHPMLVDTLKVMADKQLVAQDEYGLALKRMVRYAEEQERIISPEGTFPPIGRSIVYRVGAFQALGQVSLMQQLPEWVKPAQVRCALTKVMKNMFSAHDNFNSDGWLHLGFCGHQAGAADYYISTGSLYLTTLGFLPLGLPADNAFWTDAPEDWTSKLAWTGKAFKKDYKVDY